MIFEIMNQYISKLIIFIR